MMNDSYDILDYSHDSSYKKGDDSIFDQLADFDKLRINALTRAAEISPLIKEVTIGPRSPLKKELKITVADKENTPRKVQDEVNLYNDLEKDDLRYTLIMKQYENNLRETSEDLFKNLVEKMIVNRADTMRKYWKKQSEECESKALQLRARKLQMLKRLQENDNLLVLEKAKAEDTDSQMINRQTLENMNKILEEQNKATIRFASITDSHTKICISYNEITNLAQTEPLFKTVCDKYIPSINTVIGNISYIMDLCKAGTLTDKEVKQAEVLALNIDNIKKKIIEEVNEIKQQEIIKKQKEEEAIKQREIKEKQEQAEQAAKAQALATTLEHDKKAKPMFYSAKNYAYYKELSSYLEQYEKQYQALLEDVNYKKFRFDIKKAVNTPVNALSSVSGSHIRDKYDKLSKLLRGERVQVLDIFVIATQHPQGLAYCTALLAKKIVQQGELLVSSNPEAAFPLAAVTTALWSQFPEFGKLLEAYFHRQCPYLVPMFLPQKEGQTDKDFYLSRGYTYSEEGVVEKQDKFLKRMSGIFRLRCAIWIAKMPRFLNAPNPHGLGYGWQWLSSFINLKPEPDISATLLHDFFNVCGSEFLRCYGKQFTKIIKLISVNYLKILENIDEGGPKSRLEVFLQNVLKSGHIPPPSGLLQPNTW